MAFKDYSATPSENTEIEGPIYIGPNMFRDDVRPALQQIAADGRDLYDEIQGDIAAIPAGPPGDVGRVASRTALAALVGTITNTTRFLSESGREGLFVWNDSDLSAEVAVDTAQGIYVAPDIDPTGASGAWVRQYTGPTDVAWFGDTATAAATSAAADKAAEYFPTTSSKFSPTVNYGAQVYNLSETLEPQAVFSIKGMSSGYYSGGTVGRGPTVISAPVDTTAIRIRSNGTDGTGLSGGAVSAAGSVLEGLFITQASLGTNYNAHGIHARGTPFIKNVTVSTVAGDGVNITGDNAGGASTLGNVNLWNIDTLQLHDVRGNGLVIGSYNGVGGGADANAGLCVGLNVHAAGRAGVLDFGYYANTYVAPHINSTGQTGVQSGGRKYQLNVATKTGGAGPGSDADWYDIGALASPDANFPAYSGATTYYFTGPMLATNPAVVVTPYQENQRTLAHIPNGLVIGGNMGVTQLTPRIEGRATYGALCNMGVGHYRSTGGDTGHPAYANIGDEEFMIIGVPSPDSTFLNKRARLWWHRVEGQDLKLAFESAAGSESADLQHSGYGQIQYSISGWDTARTYGRSTVQKGIFSLHDVGLIDPNDANNARIVGIRDAAPTSGYHAVGEFYFSTQVGVLGYRCEVAGTPGTWATVKSGPSQVSSDGGTSYTFAAADANNYKQFTAGSPVTATVPPNSSVPYPIGTEIEVEQAGAGALTLAAGSGVTINSRGSDLTLAGQYAVAVLKKVATNVWTLTGDL